MIRSLIAIGLLIVVAGCGRPSGEKIFEQGLRQLERGRMSQARDLLLESIELRPGHDANAFAHHHLGVIAWREGDLETAQLHFEASHELHDELFEPVFNLGVIALESGNWMEARTWFEAASALSPRDARPWEYLAEAHRLRGDAGRREMRRALFEARARDPHSARILTALAGVEHEDGGTAEAIAFLMQALEQNAHYPPALFNLAQLYAQSPDQEEHAEAYFEQYLAVAPTGIRADEARRALRTLRAPPEPEPEAVADVAPPPSERERPAPSVEPVAPPEPPTLDELLASIADVVAAGDHDRAVARYMRLAASVRQQGERGQEERVLRAGIEQLPESATLHSALGRHYLDREDTRAAQRMFERAVELEPGWAQEWIMLAQSATARRDYDTALDALLRAVPLAPQDPSPLWALAETYEVVGINRRAAETYQQFAERFPRDARAVRAHERLQALRPPPAPEPPPEPVVEPAPRVSPEEARRLRQAREAYQRGVTYQRRQDWDSALFYYGRALAQDPTLERAHYNTGLIQLQRNRWPEARAAFQAAVELESGNAQTWYNLSYAQHQGGQRDLAIRSLNRALEINRDLAAAHLLLGILYAEDRATTARARRHYERFLELEPNDPNAASIRAWLANPS